MALKNLAFALLLLTPYTSQASLACDTIYSGKVEVGEIEAFLNFVLSIEMPPSISRESRGVRSMGTTAQIQVAKKWIERGRQIPVGHQPLGRYRKYVYYRINHLQNLTRFNAFYLLALLKAKNPQFYGQLQRDIRFVVSKTKPVGGYKIKVDLWAKQWADWYHKNALELLLPEGVDDPLIRGNLIASLAHRNSRIRLALQLKTMNPVLYEFVRSLTPKMIDQLREEATLDPALLIDVRSVAEAWHYHFMMLEHARPLIPSRGYFASIYGSMLRIITRNASAATEYQFLYHLRQRSVVLWQYLNWRIQHDWNINRTYGTSNMKPERIAYSWLYYLRSRDTHTIKVPTQKQHRNLYLALREVSRNALSAEESLLFIDILRRHDIDVYNFAMNYFDL